MRIDGTAFRTIWLSEAAPLVHVIDQRFLPFSLVIEDFASSAHAIAAIQEMHVRGAPLIGATGAAALYLAAEECAPAERWKDLLHDQAKAVRKARPTAVNLAWAVDRVLSAWEDATSINAARARAREALEAIIEEELARSQAIGRAGLELIAKLSKLKKGAPVNILTHCNAGWLACIDFGTATAPIYAAHSEGIRLHVWVDETRPRNQGASLTAFELAHEGVPCTVIADNAGGHLMQEGKVDVVIVGTDRTARNGDVANKIGTYLKALAAHDNNVPFYVAAPSSSIDWALLSGRETPIEERSPDEVHLVRGRATDGIMEVRVTPDGVPALNPGFDVTPARLITGLITERGVCRASEAGILSLFPEKGPL